VGEKITDMLVAVLNTCTKEELEEHDEELVFASPTTVSVEHVERRKIIKNKIMAVGRMARVFALLREESEKVSELKSVLGSSKLPYGTLAFGTEGIRDAINGFDDARKSDIENERLPPDLFDADSEEGKAILAQPTPVESTVQAAPVLSNGVAENADRTTVAKGLPLSRINPSPISPVSPPSPVSPISGGPPPVPKRGHSRQASLGTTMTSPSNRRRSIESTMSLIQGVLDGKGGRIEEDEAVDGLTDKLAGSSVGKANTAIPGPSRSSGR